MSTNARPPSPPVRDIDALIALIEARAPLRFRWARPRDCVSFAAAAVKAQSGIDVLAGLRWRSRRQALAFLVAQGGLEAATDRRLRRVPPALARRGDIAAVADAEHGIRLMVVEGQTLVGPGAKGLERQPRAAMIIAWDAMSAGNADG